MNDFDIEFSKIEEEFYSRPKDELLSKVSGGDVKIIIFGSGAVGCSIADSLMELGGHVLAFCDNYKRGMNERFGIPIISPEELLQGYKDVIVVVAVDLKYNDEIYQQVLDMGISKKNIFRRYSGYEIYDIDEFKRHYEGYKWAYDFFEDDISRKIILNRIRSYLFFHEMEHSPCEEQYFEKNVIDFTENEIFVDGGCFTGDTALDFIKHMNGKYSFIYGFEPEIANYEQAKMNLKSYADIELVNKGLWDKEDMLMFASGSSSSKITDNGVTSIALTSLDAFFAEKPVELLPTFIKLDIEGSEKQAIIGAKNIIEKAHPKLAICVYHKPEDIYELPKMIRELGDYKFSLRHYSEGDVETVLYAI